MLKGIAILLITTLAAYGQEVGGSSGISQPGGVAAMVSPPVPAAMWSYNKLALNDNFCSQTIDLNDTRVQGFNWYVHNAWPNQAWTILANASPTPASSITTGGCRLTISTSANSNLDYSLATCGYSSGTGSASVVGHSYGPGIYMQMTAAFNGALANTTPGIGPVIWTSSVEFLQGTLTGDFTELDGALQAAGTGAGTFKMLTSIHDWNIGLSQNNANTNDDATTHMATPGDLHLHTYGTLWVPATFNGGTGLIQYYYDGVHITSSDVSYSATGPASPGAVPSNPNGTFSSLDGTHLCILLGPGIAWPIYVTNVQVWTR